MLQSSCSNQQFISETSENVLIEGWERRFFLWLLCNP